MNNRPTWQKRVRDLQAAGMTYKQIGEQTGISPSAVGDLASGRSKEPSGDGAVLLYHLHQLRCGNPPAVTP